MNNEPVNSVSAAQREVLMTWLEERELDLALPFEDDPAYTPVATVEDNADIQAGDIRLMAPDGSAASHRLLYVAVLKVDTEGVLVAPFGRYSVPGVPGELATGRSHPVLAVLCLWNSITLPATRMLLSWRVDQLTPQELMDALWAWRFAIGEAQLPPHLEERVGPPLERTDDPRWAYCRDESLIMEQLQESSAQAYPEAYVERPMAAEKPDGDEYRTK